MQSQARNGSRLSPELVASSSSRAARSLGAKRSRINPLWPKRPIDEKPKPTTGAPFRWTSVTMATTVVVRPSDGIRGSLYREIETVCSLISTIRILFTSYGLTFLNMKADQTAIRAIHMDVEVVFLSRLIAQAVQMRLASYEDRTV